MPTRIFNPNQGENLHSFSFVSTCWVIIFIFVISQYFKMSDTSPLLLFYNISNGSEFQDLKRNLSLNSSAHIYSLYPARIPLHIQSKSITSLKRRDNEYGGKHSWRSKVCTFLAILYNPNLIMRQLLLFLEATLWIEAQSFEAKISIKDRGDNPLL